MMQTAIRDSHMPKLMPSNIAASVRIHFTVLDHHLLASDANGGGCYGICTAHADAVCPSVVDAHVPDRDITASADRKNIISTLSKSVRSIAVLCNEIGVAIDGKSLDRYVVTILNDEANHFQ